MVKNKTNGRVKKKRKKNKEIVVFSKSDHQITDLMVLVIDNTKNTYPHTNE